MDSYEVRSFTINDVRSPRKFYIITESCVLHTTISGLTMTTASNHSRKNVKCQNLLFIAHALGDQVLHLIYLVFIVRGVETKNAV